MKALKVQPGQHGQIGLIDLNRKSCKSSQVPTPWHGIGYFTAQLDAPHRLDNPEHAAGLLHARHAQAGKTARAHLRGETNAQRQVGYGH